MASKLANIRATEQRCSWLDQKIASQNFKLLALKSQIENLEAKHESLSLELRYRYSHYVCVELELELEFLSYSVKLVD